MHHDNLTLFVHFGKVQQTKFLFCNNFIHFEIVTFSFAIIISFIRMVFSTKFALI